MAKWAFDPTHHLTKDGQGVLQLYDDGKESYVQIRDSLRRIATERNEDSIDV